LAEARNTVEQCPGVGVLGRAKDVFDGPLLDEFSIQHNKDSIGEVCHDSEVMGDQEYGHSEFLTQLPKKIEDLGLNGDIESRGGFIGNE
jgi:hypothetical protein